MSNDLERSSVNKLTSMESRNGLHSNRPFLCCDDAKRIRRRGPCVGVHQAYAYLHYLSTRAALAKVFDDSHDVDLTNGDELNWRGYLATHCDSWFEELFYGHAASSHMSNWGYDSSPVLQSSAVLQSSVTGSKGFRSEAGGKGLTREKDCTSVFGASASSKGFSANISGKGIPNNKGFMPNAHGKGLPQQKDADGKGFSANKIGKSKNNVSYYFYNCN